jgi:hypothetical protein
MYEATVIPEATIFILKNINGLDVINKRNNCKKTMYLPGKNLHFLPVTISIHFQWQPYFFQGHMFTFKVVRDKPIKN